MNSNSNSIEPDTISKHACQLDVPFVYYLIRELNVPYVWHPDANAPARTTDSVIASSTNISPNIYPPGSAVVVASSDQSSSSGNMRKPPIYYVRLSVRGSPRRFSPPRWPRRFAFKAAPSPAFASGAAAARSGPLAEKAAPRPAY